MYGRAARGACDNAWRCLATPGHVARAASIQSTDVETHCELHNSRHDVSWLIWVIVFQEDSHISERITLVILMSTLAHWIHYAGHKRLLLLLKRWLAENKIYEFTEE